MRTPPVTDSPKPWISDSPFRIDPDDLFKRHRTDRSPDIPCLTPLSRPIKTDAKVEIGLVWPDLAAEVDEPVLGQSRDVSSRITQTKTHPIKP